MTERSVPVLEGRGLVNLRHGERVARRRLHRRGRHGDRADRRQRRRQVDARQGAVGVEHPDDGAILLDGEPVCSARRWTPIGWASRRSSRTSRSRRTSTPPGTPSSAARSRRFGVFNPQAGDAPVDDGGVRRPRGHDRAGRLGAGDVAVGRAASAVAIARSAMWAKRVIFFDEPTAALGVVQTRRVLELIRRVPRPGLGVVLITHTLPDVLEVADRVEVLRFGRRTATSSVADATVELLVSAITGVY